MNGGKLECAQCVKDLGITITSSLKFFEQFKDAAGKVNWMLGFINRDFPFKDKDIILPLYISLVRPHLEYAVQFLSPHHTKEITKLEAVQGRATMMITYSQRETDTSNLFSLQKRWLWGNYLVFQNRVYELGAGKLFLTDSLSQRSDKPSGLRIPTCCP